VRKDSQSKQQQQQLQLPHRRGAEAPRKRRISKFFFVVSGLFSMLFSLRLCASALLLLQFFSDVP
jgi:hypothetical protein